jgi:bifunctional DNA-binding transcriptional regulator/antitoxin component of YhaV-PrlF toxin-antitoxin module
MSEKQTFEVLLEKHKNMEATHIRIPFDVEQVFGAKRVPVKISVNGADYRSTIFRMDGKYLLGLPKRFREAAGISAGEMITVEIERDTEIRVIIPPKDLAEALAENNQAKEIWENLSCGLFCAAKFIIEKTKINIKTILFRNISADLQIKNKMRIL